MPLNKTQFEVSWASRRDRDRLSKLLAPAACDVAHFHTVVAPFVLAQALRRTRAARVATFHEVPPDTPVGALQRLALRTIDRLLMSRLDQVIFASQTQLALHPRVDPACVTVIPPAIDLGRFGAGIELAERRRDDLVDILFFGRLEPRKGAIVLLKAFAKLRAGGLPVRLLVAGDGPQRRTLQEFVQRHGVLDVAFLGRIADGDVPRLYASCDIYCAPSLYGEGFGIVLVEAMASGRPVVAAANAGYRTVLSGEAARFLVPPGDVAALARALEELVTHPSLRQRLADWGRREAKRYDSGALAPAFVAVYEAAIRARG